MVGRFYNFTGLHFQFLFLRTENAIDTKAITSMTPDIGSVKNGTRLPWLTISPLRKFVSIRGPRTNPIIMGGRG
jgi:hypothetical protein